MARMHIPTIDLDTIESECNSTRRRISPRKQRPAGSPMELRSVVTRVVRTRDATDTVRLIHAAVIKQVSTINSGRGQTCKLNKPSRRMVKYLILEHRRHQAMLYAKQIPASRFPDPDPI